MQSSAAHLYIISASHVALKDCLFPGGEEGTGGILVAEEAFYQVSRDTYITFKEDVLKICTFLPLCHL